MKKRSTIRLGSTTDARDDRYRHAAFSGSGTKTSTWRVMQKGLNQGCRHYLMYFRTWHRYHFFASFAMYLVVDPASRSYIFTENDPRGDGYDGQIEPGVKLDESGTLDSAAIDATVAVPCLGRSATNEKHYRVFESVKQCRNSGFEPCGAKYAKYQTWNEFQKEIQGK